MATKRWLATAKQVTQISTITIAGTWLAGDTITVTIGTIELIVTVGSLVTPTQIATTIVEAWAAAVTSFTDTTAASSPTIAQGGAYAIPQFYEAIPTSALGVVTLTARSTGVPFVAATTKSSAAGTVADATTTAATGKWFNDNIDNWSGNSNPVDADDIVVDTGDVDIRYGALAIQPGSFTVTKGYSGRIGLATINAFDSARKYNEYRTTDLTFTVAAGPPTTTITIGRGEGQGSGLIRINAQTCPVTLLVLSTGSRTVSDYPSFMFRGSHATSDGTLSGGEIGIAFTAGETAQFATLRTGGGGLAPKVYCGTGLTVATVKPGDGELTINSNSTTLTQTGGTVTQMAGAPATLLCHKGKFNHWSTGTIGTACTIGKDGFYDRTGETRAATITPQVQLYGGSKFYDPNATLTLTGGYKKVECRDKDADTDFGYNRAFTVA